MTPSIVPLGPVHYPEVYQLLANDEPWSIIPFDALLNDGIGHPKHRWFGEMENNRSQGVIYQYDRMLYVTYHPFAHHSQLDRFLQRYINQFFISGPSSTLNWLMKQLPSFDAALLDRSRFVVQSKRTAQLLHLSLSPPAHLSIRLATQNDYASLLSLFQGTEVEHEVDPLLLWQLLQTGSVMVAERNQLVGSVMRLKESPCYTLLGGLFVHPAYRNQGIATFMGQHMLKQVITQGKKSMFLLS